MKQVNGTLQPEKFAEATGSWILFTAGVTCGLCLRGKQRDEKPRTPEHSKRIAEESRFIDPNKAIPILNKGSKQQRWQAYKRHIATVHRGNWNLDQGFGFYDNNRE